MARRAAERDLCAPCASPGWRDLSVLLSPPPSSPFSIVIPSNARDLLFSCLLITGRWSQVADNVLIWMRTVGAKGECAGDLRNAGGPVLSIHNASYHTIYQLSIDIVRY